MAHSTFRNWLTSRADGGLLSNDNGLRLGFGVFVALVSGGALATIVTTYFIMLGIDLMLEGIDSNF